MRRRAIIIVHRSSKLHCLDDGQALTANPCCLNILSFRDLKSKMALLVPAVMSEVNRKASTSLKPKPKSLTTDFICNSKSEFKQTYYLITDLI